MVDWRTLMLGVAAFSGTFAGGMWLNGGGLSSLAGLSLANIKLPSALAGVIAEIAPSGRTKMAAVAQPHRLTGTGPGLTDNEALRRSVILRARAYLSPSCNSDPRGRYISAASRYAEALMRSAGCNSSRCNMSESLLDDVWRRNASPRDREVAAAMAAVNAAGGLSEKSFREDVGRAVRVIAGQGFARRPPPVCRSAEQARRVRFRFRFRRK